MDINITLGQLQKPRTKAKDCNPGDYIVIAQGHQAKGYTHLDGGYIIVKVSNGSQWGMLAQKQYAQLLENRNWSSSDERKERVRAFRHALQEKVKLASSPIKVSFKHHYKLYARFVD